MSMLKRVIEYHHGDQLSRNRVVNSDDGPCWAATSSVTPTRNMKIC